MLNTKKEKYASSEFPGRDDAGGYYFADSVVDPFVEKVRDIVPAAFERHRASSEFVWVKNANVADISPGSDGRRLSLEQSKALVIEALEKYDPALGAKAKNILNSNRLQTASLSEIPPERTARECYDPDTRTIHYERLNGSINDPVMLAHELGHAIADDYIREHGLTDADQKKHMVETQAYFVQHILYDHLRQHPDQDIATAATRHYTATMSRNIYNMAVSLAAADAQKEINAGRSVDMEAELRRTLGLHADEYAWWSDFVRERVDAAAAAARDTATESGKRKEALKNLDEEARYLHERPMSILAAGALYEQVKNKDAGVRRRTAEALFSRQGPKDICEVMAVAGVERKEDMKNIANKTIEKSLSGVDQKTELQYVTSPAPDLAFV
jgi:hypothetical protein